MIPGLYESAKQALTKLDNAIQKEYKADYRYRFAARRTRRLVDSLIFAQQKYIELRDKPVPKKIAKRKKS